MEMAKAATYLGALRTESGSRYSCLGGGMSGVWLADSLPFFVFVVVCSIDARCAHLLHTCVVLVVRSDGSSAVLT